ncbi:MAG: 1,4-dihydroxy-6-naphthoate synthase [Bacteroidales bacterium]|nr:1,4-dihydroxy-6-naphthoate synthase [Bacteroidales bacterium]
MNVKLAFSSCPNDTFMFHAMVHGLVDTEGLSFDVDIHDVEELNERARRGLYDVTKLSYHGWFGVRDAYAMLDAGSALGWDCGPLLVCRAGDERAAERSPLRIAVPGRYTTGALLCSLAYPGLGEQIPMLFSDIEEAVGRGAVDLGVLIHEGRFTYRDKGLALVRDLGAWWQDTTGCPIPLGGIAVRTALGADFAAVTNRVLHRSISYAFAHPEASRAYVASYARELSAAVQQKHIDLFVNRFSLDLGEEGHRAVDTLYRCYERDYLRGGREEALPHGRQCGEGA